MDNKKKNKSLAKDIAILMTVWGPLLFIIIGGTMWKNDKFDGTIMEQLFPALFFGFLAAFAVAIILSNLFKYSTTLWAVGAIVALIATVVCYMLDFINVLIVGGIAISVILCVLVLIRWIAGSLR